MKKVQQLWSRILAEALIHLRTHQPRRRSIRLGGEIILLAAFGLLVQARPCAAQAPLLLDQLKLKGTHNSYAANDGSLFGCGSNSCPVMRDAPWVQVDNFGVWALELDFGFGAGADASRLIVGHDGPGCWTPAAWGYYLDDFLDSLKTRSRALAWRPIIVYLEYKGWGTPQGPWILEAQKLLEAKFAPSEVFGPKDMSSPSEWPTVAALARKFIFNAIGPDAPSQWIFTGLNGGWPDGGTTLSRGGPPVTDGYTCPAHLGELAQQNVVIAADEYELDWTYANVDPPNPIYVQAGAPSVFVLRTDLSSSKHCEDDHHMIYGASVEACDGTSNGPACEQPNEFACGAIDPTNYNHDYYVRAHGTFATPYPALAPAVNTAPAGWTIVLEAGEYPSPVRITKHIRLEASRGAVVIGK